MLEAFIIVLNAENRTKPKRELGIEMMKSWTSHGIHGLWCSSFVLFLASAHECWPWMLASDQLSGSDLETSESQVPKDVSNLLDPWHRHFTSLLPLKTSETQTNNTTWTSKAMNFWSLDMLSEPWRTRMCSPHSGGPTACCFWSIAKASACGPGEYRDLSSCGHSRSPVAVLQKWWCFELLMIFNGE